MMAKKSKDLYIKFLIFLLIFLIIFVIFLFFIIAPNIQEYRAKKIEYEKIEKQSLYISAQKQNFFDEVKALKLKNKKIVDSFQNNFNEREFIEFAKNFFDHVSLIKIDTQSDENGFTVYEFRATSNMKTPAKFYQFIEELQTYENIIKVDFPITLDSKQKMIDIGFKLNIYKLEMLLN